MGLNKTERQWYYNLLVLQDRKLFRAPTTASIIIVSTISQADDFMFVSFIFFSEPKSFFFKRWLTVIAHEWSKLRGCLQNVCFCTAFSV